MAGVNQLKYNNLNRSSPSQTPPTNHSATATAAHATMELKPPALQPPEPDIMISVELLKSLRLLNTPPVESQARPPKVLTTSTLLAPPAMEAMTTIPLPTETACGFAFPTTPSSEREDQHFDITTQLV